MKIISELLQDSLTESSFGVEVPFYHNDKQVGVSKVIKLDDILYLETNIEHRFEYIFKVELFGHILEQKEGKITKLDLKSVDLIRA